jgi:hypothetical protein
MLFGMLAGSGHYTGSFPFFPWFIIIIVLGFALAYYMIFQFSANVAKTWP